MLRAISTNIQTNCESFVKEKIQLIATIFYEYHGLTGAENQISNLNFVAGGDCCIIFLVRFTFVYDWLNDETTWQFGIMYINFDKNSWSSSCSQYPMSSNKIWSVNVFAKSSIALVDTFLVPMILRYLSSVKLSWIAKISRSDVCRWAVKNNLAIFWQLFTTLMIHPVLASTLEHHPKSNSTRSVKCDNAVTPLYH